MNNFLEKFSGSEIRIAAEVLSNWFPYISRNLCKSCVGTLFDSIRSIPTEGNFAVSTARNIDIERHGDDEGNCLIHSSDCIKEHVEPSTNAMSSASRTRKRSHADIGMENELAEEEDTEMISRSSNDNASSMAMVGSPEVGEVKKEQLSRDQRESIRLSIVERKLDFVYMERVNGRVVNILEGLELHKGVFSAKEQKRIVRYVEELQEMGRNGQLKERTYSAPHKWMRGKGRITIQFGCCYNYAKDRKGNPPGILKNEMVDPLPDLFKVMIRRLVKWHVLEPSSVPDSCIVNIYEEGDCIPPHIDSHDFVRPFCTVSLLSECEILFGSNLKIVGPGEFAGSYRLPLPVGSVLVLNGNGADVAKHCVPAVPSKRISITFRKMDTSKRPYGYTPEPDLQGLQPLPAEVDRPIKSNSNNNVSSPNEDDYVNDYNRLKRRSSPRDERVDRRRGIVAENPDHRYSSWRQ